MLPTDGWAIVVFLVAVTPGLLFDLLSDRKAVRPKESAFRETSRIVLVSTLVGVPTALLIAALSELHRFSFLPNISKWVAAPKAYASGHSIEMLGALTSQVMISSALAAAAYFVINRGKPSLKPVPTWRKVFRDDNPSSTPPTLRVRLTRGTIYQGTLCDYTASFEASRDVVLAPPFRVKRDGGTYSAVPEAWQRIVIASDQIETIAVLYLEPEDDDPPRPPETERSRRCVTPE